MRILIIEDEEKLASALRRGLEAEQFEVSVAGSGEDGFFLANSEAFDVVLLDLMLPNRSGIEVLELLRERAIQVPVLVLTAKDTVQDRVRGLNCGADDYLVKPFAFEEVLARIRALLRRGRVDQLSRLRYEDLEMDFIARKATRAGRPIELTAKEFDLLGYLLRNRDRVVSREMLARDVWKAGPRATPLDNVIDVMLARLRRKIDDPYERKVLHTVRGIGFVLGDAVG